MHADNRLGLCLGAGVSEDFNIPNWKELIKRIAKHPLVNGVPLLGASESLTAQSQFLYQRYLQSRPGDDTDNDDVLQARRVGMEWMRIVHECLYESAKTTDDDLAEHPYLWDLVPLIKKSVMTINYNFDDTVERTLYLRNTRTEVTNDDKGFETVWQPSSQFRRNNGVIYHPNGFLPLQTIDGFSEQIVFMEQEFADQLVDISAGHYVSLLNHLSKNTIIFLGLSLSDANLKHLLRVSARHNPGNFHYHIHWCSENNKPPEDEQDAIRKANFSIYNLVTLFLTTDEVKELTKLLLMTADEFSEQCDTEHDGVCTEYNFYITGSVGSGKSTVLEQIRSIKTFDEWVDRRHPLLGRPHSELKLEERQDVDNWINQQFRKKNRRINAAYQSISIIDRSPLDPLYFVADRHLMSGRAKELLQCMVPNQGTVKQIAPGHIIILKCDPKGLRIRLASRGKTYSAEQLIPQIEIIEETWMDFPVTYIDTTNLSISQVVSKILETILFSKYEPINLHRLCSSKTESIL